MSNGRLTMRGRVFQGIVFASFALGGADSFPNSYEPPVQEIRWINRNILVPWGWGRDGVENCGRPLQPFKCVVVADNWPEMFGLRNKLDIITENMPVKWPDGGGPVLQSEPEKTSKEPKSAEILPESKTELPVDVPQPPRLTTPPQIVVQPAKAPSTGPKSFCRPIINAKSDNRVRSSIRVQTKKPQSVKEPASVVLPVEYIGKTIIRPISVIEIEEPKKEVQVRTSFDVGVRRNKRH